MTTRAVPDIPERAYEQTAETLSDLAESFRALRAEIGSLKTTIIVIGAGVWASTVGGFIALLVTD